MTSIEDKVTVTGAITQTPSIGPALVTIPCKFYIASSNRVSEDLLREEGLQWFGAEALLQVKKGKEKINRGDKVEIEKQVGGSALHASRVIITGYNGKETVYSREK